jgi:hypothetical protein
VGTLRSDPELELSTISVGGALRRHRASTAMPNTPSRSAAELLIDREEDRTVRAVLVGMLREADRGSQGRTGSTRRTVSLRASGHRP